CASTSVRTASRVCQDGGAAVPTSVQDPSGLSICLCMRSAVSSVVSYLSPPGEVACVSMRPPARSSVMTACSTAAYQGELGWSFCSISRDINNAVDLTDLMDCRSWPTFNAAIERWMTSRASGGCVVANASGVVVNEMLARMAATAAWAVLCIGL